MRAVKGNGLARFKVAQKIREEAAFDAVDTEVELVCAWGGRDGIGAGLRLAVGILGDGRDELSRYEIECFQLIDGKFKMKTLRRIGEQKLALKPGGK
jgi:hypothetical protein